jgi:hypothetical protein
VSSLLEAPNYHNSNGIEVHFNAIIFVLYQNLLAFLNSWTLLSEHTSSVVKVPVGIAECLRQEAPDSTFLNWNLRYFKEWINCGPIMHSPVFGDWATECRRLPKPSRKPYTIHRSTLPTLLFMSFMQFENPLGVLERSSVFCWPPLSIHNLSIVKLLGEYQDEEEMYLWTNNTIDLILSTVNVTMKSNYLLIRGTWWYWR